jgi:hypothetical protein
MNYWFAEHRTTHSLIRSNPRKTHHLTRFRGLVASYTLLPIAIDKYGSSYLRPISPYYLGI